MLILLIDLLKKIGGKKEKKENSSGFYTELDLTWNREGPGARGEPTSLK